MNLYTEARTIAQEAWDMSAGDMEAAQEYVQQTCDGHELGIYHYHAIQFCADHDTSRGEEWLEDCGGIAQPGDSFGQIACRIAYATLLCAVEEALAEIEAEAINAALVD
jgi:hypothetical protein